MFRYISSGAALVAALFLLTPMTRSASAVEFSTSYLDGGSWRTIYAQGFKASVSPTPDPGYAIGDTVFLDRFQFFKSGSVDTAANIRLAIVDNIFIPLNTFTTTTPQLIGLSTNTITSTAGIATGDPITFNFDSLPLVYGLNDQEELANNNYAAIFVNVGEDTGSGAPLTPVLVSALSVDYLAGVNEIESDYGLPGNYFLSVSNYFEADGLGDLYFKTFNQTDSGGYGDANFVATFNLPASLAGDFNVDGIVDAADYTVWRDGLGGAYDLDDYNDWKMNFGMSSGSGGLAAGGAVPEPTAHLVAFMAIAIGGVVIRHRGINRN